MSPRQRRVFGALVFAAALIAFVMWAFSPRAVLVDVAPVARQTLVEEISEEAKTRIREVYVVSAPVAGRLERVAVEAGDPVRVGATPLARIRPAEPVFLDRRTLAELESAAAAAEAARDAGVAEVERARTQYEQAQIEFDRERRLFESGTVAKARFDAARASRDSARAAWDAARQTLRAREADLARARAALIEPSRVGDAAAPDDGDDACCVVLGAAVDGVVLGVAQESESVVPAGAPILEIGDPRDLEIVSEMLSADAVRVEPEARVRIDGWGGPQLEGRVRRIEPSAFTKISALGIEEQRVNVVIDIVSPREDWARLAHRYRVDVHVEVARVDDALAIPMAALFRQDGSWACFAIEQGRARLRRVEIGRANDRAAEIVAGLADGDEVVLHPSDRIAEGVRIAPRG